MESIARVHCRLQPFHLSLNPNRPSFQKPISSLCFTTPSQPFKSLSIRASSSSSPSPSSPTPLYHFFKTATVTLTAAAALFCMQLHLKKPALASPVTTSSTVEPTNRSNENLSLEDEERAIEERLSQSPDDVEALRELMEVKIKSRKLLEAIEVVNRLMELEPTDEEWPLLKSQIYTYSGDYDSARKGFEEILQKDPLRVEAYHGLLMVNSEIGDSLDEVTKRIQAAVDKCKKEKKTSDVRDFKLLIAQVSVMSDKYEEALKIYEEMVKEEPRDFRPYLCQGIIYTLLRKKDEAEKKFEMFRKLVPKNHPYREYLVDNMFASQFFSEKVERERAGAQN